MFSMYLKFFTIGRLPKISIVLPFYNAGETLGRAIASLAHQTLGDFECIMVDNGSMDQGPVIAADWARRDTRFLLVTESRQGVVFASNTGSLMARGRYICRMDADDEAYPDRLLKKYNFLEQNPAYGVVACLVEYVPFREGAGGFQRYVDWSNSLQGESDIRNRRFIESPIVNPAALWRKEVADQHGMYRQGDFPEDYELWLRWLHEGVRMVKIPNVLLRWHDSAKRLTRTHPMYRDKAFFMIKSHYLALWLSKHNHFHPRVAVWGASRISRRRARLLEQHGVQVDFYIDIKHGRQLDKKVVYYQDIPPPNEVFVLVYIKQMDARYEIQDFLHDRGFKEGLNYLLVS